MSDVAVMDKFDRMLNDILDIVSSLDGRVRKLEIKTQIKKRPSYLKVVGDKEPSIADDIRLEQFEHKLELIHKAVTTISERVTALEEQ